MLPRTLVDQPAGLTGLLFSLTVLWLTGGLGGVVVGALNQRQWWHGERRFAVLLVITPGDV
jgi:hypothetical protein